MNPTSSMNTIFLALAYLLVSVSSLLAQALPPLKPQIGITVFADGKPANQRTGIKATTKEIRFNALMNTKSNGVFKDFQSELLIKNTEVILARNNRKVAQVNVPDGRLPIDMIQQAQPTDHIIFKFTLVAQRKNGERIALEEQPVYNFSIQK